MPGSVKPDIGTHIDVSKWAQSGPGSSFSTPGRLAPPPNCSLLILD